MRISWLSPDDVGAARNALSARHDTWGAHFRDDFTPGPAPAAIDEGRWPQVAEHVARAERVVEVLHEQGFDAAMERFGASEHAIELATVTAAAAAVERATFDMVRELLRCEIDECIAYGGFLDLLCSLGTERQEHTLATYEHFCEAFASLPSRQPMWAERVATVRDGLAGLYVVCGRFQEAHELYSQRHEQERTLLVALGASRAFLAAGEVGRAMLWLGKGAERADEIGRGAMAQRLRDKAEALRARQS